MADGMSCVVVDQFTLENWLARDDVDEQPASQMEVGQIAGDEESEKRSDGDQSEGEQLEGERLDSETTESGKSICVESIDKELVDGRSVAGQAGNDQTIKDQLVGSSENRKSISEDSKSTDEAGESKNDQLLREDDKSKRSDGQDEGSAENQVKEDLLKSESLESDAPNQKIIFFFE